MIGALLLLGLASAADVPSASLALQSALEAELARVSALRLPDAPSPWLVSFDVLDGPIHYAAAEDGAQQPQAHLVGDAGAAGRRARRIRGTRAAHDRSRAACEQRGGDEEHAEQRSEAQRAGGARGHAAS